ncbi:hypothetical protein BJY00DRAFT_286418 [Aspergillus carlsbadensis]|nr:hypothetical protein BJY00DRAFT_286418 [Aspergillus carlsbadensis]
MAPSLLDLPGEIRNQVYTHLLVRTSPVYLYSKKGLAPSILYTNKTIHQEVRSILYSCNCLDLTSGFIATRDFLRAIGRDNAALIQSVRIFFPGVMGMLEDDDEEEEEEVTSGNIQSKMVGFLASHGVRPRRIMTTWQSSTGLIRQLDSLGDMDSVHETLVPLNARFRSSELTREIVVEVYHDIISKDVERAMQSYGWEVRRVVRHYNSAEEKDAILANGEQYYFYAADI